MERAQVDEHANVVLMDAMADVKTYQGVDVTVRTSH
jgi:hypothetical protein